MRVNKINKALILLATELEAKPWISTLGNPQTTIGPLQFYTGQTHDVLITGIGPLSSATSCGWATQFNHSRWFNLGVAGSLKNKLHYGDIIEVRTTTFDPLPFGLPQELATQDTNAKGRLVTVVQPIHDQAVRERLGLCHDVVDMEGFPIALAAHHMHCQLSIIKIVSDECNTHDQPLIRARIPGLMHQLWDYWSQHHAL